MVLTVLALQLDQFQLFCRSFLRSELLSPGLDHLFFLKYFYYLTFNNFTLLRLQNTVFFYYFPGQVQVTDGAFAIGIVQNGRHAKTRRFA